MNREPFPPIYFVIALVFLAAVCCGLWLLQVDCPPGIDMGDGAFICSFE